MERTAPEAAQPGSPPSTSRDRDAHCLTPRLILRRTVGQCGGFRTTIRQVDALDTASQSGPDGTVGLAPTTDVEIERQPLLLRGCGEIAQLVRVTQ